MTPFASLASDDEDDAEAAGEESLLVVDGRGAVVVDGIGALTGLPGGSAAGGAASSSSHRQVSQYNRPPSLTRLALTYLVSLPLPWAVYDPRKRARLQTVSDVLSLHDTTGLFEDLALHSCHAVDRIFAVLRGKERLSLLSAYDLNASLTRHLDMRSIAQVVQDHGYPFEQHLVTTIDGYILELDRLPRPEARRVLILQHGVVDSSFGWVSNGPDGGSLAFKAHDEGIDVFMGNFRGVGSRRGHVNPNISNEDYWNFTVNDHALRDLPAFIAKVRELKADCGEELEITLVAHSMGGAAALYYLVDCGARGADPGIVRSVLMSPAGVHYACPLLCRATGPVIDRTIAK